PLIFFLVSLFGIVLESTEGLQHSLFSFLLQILPPSAFTLVRKTIEEIVDSSSGGKLTVGLLVTFWSASAGVDSVRTALNAVYGLNETRSWWKTKSQSILLTFAVVLLTGITLAVVFYGWQMVEYSIRSIGWQVSSPLVLVSIQWAAIIALLVLACEIFFNLVPNFRELKWKWITAGSIVSIILWILFTGGFRLYLQYFNLYSKTYGSLGAVIILMLWLYLTALALMIGGAINSVLQEFSSETPDRVTEN
ncbi:MAG: YihY/virulence factor BrkB family protein, partial [Pyrinomonadaceae bacterium]